MSGNKLDLKNGKQVSSISEYKENLVSVIKNLKKLSPKAKLIFATTTPVPDNAKGRIAGDAVRYNAAALGVLKAYPEIQINDLYSLTKPNQQIW